MGVMHFPNDLEKANAYSSQIMVSGPLETYYSIYGDLPGQEYRSLLSSLRIDISPEQILLRKQMGHVVGLFTQALWSLICMDRKVASVSKSLQVTENHAFSDPNKFISRAQLYRYIQEMKSVLHFWGTLAIRRTIHGREWLADSTKNYNYYTDFHSFLTEAQLLRWELIKWASESGSKHLQSEYFSAPEEWLSSQRQVGWPATGKLSAIFLPSEWVPRSHPVGRPRKRNPVAHA